MFNLYSITLCNKKQEAPLKPLYLKTTDLGSVMLYLLGIVFDPFAQLSDRWCCPLDAATTERAAETTFAAGT